MRQDTGELPPDGRAIAPYRPTSSQRAFGAPPSLRVLVAPNSFKGNLSAARVCQHLAAGLRVVQPSTQVLQRPLADGGEGTLEALEAAGAVVRQTTATGPLGEPVTARWAWRDGTAFVEAAQVAGASLVPAPDGSTAMAASTQGVGELIRAALDAGARRIVLTLGDSATTDGGAGMLRALGLRLLTADGRPVPPGGAGLGLAENADASRLDPRLTQTVITIASDVENPLLGRHGTAAVFAPQKGAGPEEIAALELGLSRWVDILGRALRRGPDVARLAVQKGAGASGGLAFGACAAFGARVVSGADLILDLLDVDSALDAVDLAITGEGSLDSQSLRGKAPTALASRARARGVPVVAVAGQVTLTEQELKTAGIDRAWSLTDLAGDAQGAIAQASRLLEQQGAAVAAWWHRER